MPTDQEDVAGAVCFFHDDFCSVVVSGALGVVAVALFRFTIGGNDFSSMAVAGECQPDKVCCVAECLVGAV